MERCFDLYARNPSLHACASCVITRDVLMTWTVCTDELIAGKELFHEIGGELDCAFVDLGLQPSTPPPMAREASNWRIFSTGP
ncbi:hypothetical protein K1T71_009380 [Dendrolimus kikuchii]|uniref:Uncharacterized protein n=1 Tax=Dendrolimus kikuchii TaxID=765133 RepID=A0ACC1CUX3_9NEOP|nr:hypothetical protein K1T71_009380 [Dendrolimus kikuchii]